MLELFVKAKKQIDEEFEYLEKYYFKHPQERDMLIELHIKVENSLEELEEEFIKNDSSCKM
jgi:CHASE3 domain sensor protein